MVCSGGDQKSIWPREGLSKGWHCIFPRVSSPQQVCQDLWSFPPGSVSSATPQVCARPLVTSLLKKAPSYRHLCAHLLSGPSQPLRTGRRFKDYLVSLNVLVYS